MTRVYKLHTTIGLTITGVYNYLIIEKKTRLYILMCYNICGDQTEYWCALDTRVHAIFVQVNWKLENQ